VVSCAVLQHGIELCFGDSELVRCHSLWPAGDWWAWYSPDIMDSPVAHFMLDSGWASGVREFSVSTSVPPVMMIMLGISGLAA
jgi:hypothetical protein